MHQVDEDGVRSSTRSAAGVHSQLKLLGVFALVLAIVSCTSTANNISAEVSATIESSVDNYIESRYTDALYRTYEDERAATNAEYEWFQNEASERERERFVFDLLLEGLFIAARDSLPNDLKPGGTLELAYTDALDECAAAAGYEGLDLYDHTLKYYEAALVEYQLSADEYADINHECAKYAVEYPTLSEAERERLLSLRRDFYLDVVRTFLEENPDAVVPLG